MVVSERIIKYIVRLPLTKIKLLGKPCCQGSDTAYLIHLFS